MPRSCCGAIMRNAHGTLVAFDDMARRVSLIHRSTGVPVAGAAADHTCCACSIVVRNLIGACCCAENPSGCCTGGPTMLSASSLDDAPFLISASANSKAAWRRARRSA